MDVFENKHRVKFTNTGKQVKVYQQLLPSTGLYSFKSKNGSGDLTLLLNNKPFVE